MQVRSQLPDVLLSGAIRATNKEPRLFSVQLPLVKLLARRL